LSDFGNTLGHHVDDSFFASLIDFVHKLVSLALYLQ